MSDPTADAPRKLDPKDAALIAFIDTIHNTGGVVELTEEESVASYGAPYGCKFDRESTDLASAYLLACEAAGVEPLIERLPKGTRILSVNIYVDRDMGDYIEDEQNDAECELVHGLAATFPGAIRKVRVCDRKGNFLYFADSREGD